MTERSFTNAASVRKVAIMTRVMQLLHDVLRRRIHVTKRDLFYNDVKLFKDQLESDTVIEDVAAMIGCTRPSLHVVASEKGVVVGNISFFDDGDEIDCTRMGVGGKAIPPSPDRVSRITGTAQVRLRARPLDECVPECACAVRAAGREGGRVPAARGGPLLQPVRARPGFAFANAVGCMGNCICAGTPA